MDGTPAICLFNILMGIFGTDWAEAVVFSISDTHIPVKDLLFYVIMAAQVMIMGHNFYTILKH